MLRKNEITREWLEKQHIDVSGRKIYHTTPRRGKVELVPSLIESHPKYGKPVKYYQICWYNGEEKKQYNILAHRLIYAWYNGVCSGDTDIDHIDGNSLNNSIYNLEAITHNTNIGRRRGNGHNNTVYYGMNGLSDVQVDRLLCYYRELKEFREEQVKYRKELRELIHWHKNEIKKTSDIDSIAIHKHAIIDLKKAVKESIKQVEDKVNRINLYKSNKEC